MESISYFQRCIHFTLKSTQLPKTRRQVYKGKHRQWFPLRKTTNPWTRWSPGRSLWPRSRATDFVPLDLSKKYFLTDVLLCSHDNWKKVENTILWKLQQSVLLYYPGIRRFLLVMSYSFHLHLASHVRTCESSEQLRIPLKMNMQRMWNQAKGVSMLVARRETKHRDWDFSDWNISGELWKPHAKGNIKMWTLEEKLWWCQRHQELSSSQCSPPEVA